jgi:hypothetical protein
MAATTRQKPPRRPAMLRRLSAVLALAAVLLLGAMATTALAAPRTTPVRSASYQSATAPAQPVPASRPAAAVLPLVLGAIVILAAYNPVPRFHNRH